MTGRHTLAAVLFDLYRYNRLQHPEKSLDDLKRVFGEAVSDLEVRYQSELQGRTL